MQSVKPEDCDMYYGVVSAITPMIAVITPA